MPGRSAPAGITVAWLPKLARLVIVMLGLAAGAAPGRAADWQWDDLSVRLDSSITMSTSLRVQSRDCKQIATVNGGCNPDGSQGTQARLLNSDDGNLNYGKGQFFSVLAQATHDVQLDWREFGAFVRFSYFADALQAQAGNTDRTDLTKEARFRDSLLQSGVVGAHFYFLDAYAYATFEAWDRLFDVRVGNQVLNWGESVFTQGGVNTISTLDVTKIRLAGSELRDALLPAPIFRVSTTLFDELSLEAYYQMVWRKTLIDPVGTFFSTNDLVSRGARAQYTGGLEATLGLGSCGDEGTSFFDRSTALGGCPDGGPALATFPYGFPLLRRKDAHDQGQFGAALRWYLDEIQTEFALYYIRLHDKFPTLSYRGTALDLATCNAPPVGVPKPGCDAGYIVEYKNNIDLYGFSLNTVIWDIAWGFELSYRRNQPTPLNTGAQVQDFVTGLLGDPGTARQVDGQRRVDRLVVIGNMLWVIGPGDGLAGWFVRLVRASEMNFIAEGSLTHYPQLEGGRSAYAGPLGVSRPKLDQNDEIVGYHARPDETGGGYQLRLSATYERFLGSPFSVQPTVAFRHDVAGITPAGEAAWNEKVKQVSLSLQVDYLNRWRGLLSYSNAFSGGQRNGSNDRDFVGLSVSYAF